MAIGDSDLGVFFADFGVPVVFGGVTAQGIFDAPGKDAIFDRTAVSDVDYALTLPAAAFSPMPKSGSRLTVSGVAYQVRSSNPLDDGALVDLRLRKL